MQIKKLSTLFISLIFITSCYHDEYLPPPPENPTDSSIMSRGILEYPDIFQILGSSTVYNAAYAAWKEMLKSCTQFSRREIGFYIYYKESENDYIIGTWKYGPLVPYTQGEANLNLGAPLFPLTVCAFFHCHPPYYTVGKRKTGASWDDEALALKYGIPGVVFDYSGSYVDAFYPYEDEADSPCPYIFGPRQRTPYIY